MSSPPPGTMQQFKLSHTQAEVDRAVDLYRQAQTEFAKMPGGDKFTLYSQDNAEVFEKRFNHPPAQQDAQMLEPSPNDTNAPSVGRRKYGCNLCPSAFKTFEFQRHNKEIHKKDPAKAFLCPKAGCMVVIYRLEAARIDEHLATCCQEYPNDVQGARAYKFLTDLKATTLSKLSKKSLDQLAERGRSALNGIAARRDEVLPKLPTDLGESFTIEELTIPEDLLEKDTSEMKKSDFIDYIIDVRRVLARWERGFTEAREFLEEN